MVCQLSGAVEGLVLTYKPGFKRAAERREDVTTVPVVTRETGEDGVTRESGLREHEGDEIPVVDEIIDADGDEEDAADEVDEAAAHGELAGEPAL
jgi:hypothetical protein